MSEILIKKIKELEKLAEISLYLNSGIDLSVLLEKILKVSRDNFDCEDASLMLLNEKTQELYFEVIESKESEALKKITLKPGEGIAGKVAATGEPLIIEDAEADPRFSKKGDEVTFKKTINMMCVPLKFKDKIIGTMQVINKKSGSFNFEDLPQFLAIANLAAIAIENARLYKQLAENFQRIKELEASKSQFIGLLSHELLTPIVPIKGYTEMLIDGLDNFNSEEIKKYLKVIVKETSRLNMLIHDLFIINNIEKVKEILNLEIILLIPFLEELKEDFQKRVSRHEIILETNLIEEILELKISADKEKLGHCFNHLLENAVKFSPQGGKIIIRIKNYLSQINQVSPKKWIEIQVEDQGIGIPEEEREKIFKKFYQIDSSFTRVFEGMGIGLYICREIIEAHQGEIFCVSQDGIGSIFYIHLPYLSH
ncbi:MAG: GAF domain-containing sensor histidine kinase [Armatimonadetes bacterium]|nr:GAF domain-containing sensor histidine kinase [Armatimonadota bacterium]